MIRGRLHLAFGYKPPQIAFRVAGRFGGIMLFDVAEQRDLRVRQIIRHFGASDSGPCILPDRHQARIAAGRGCVGGGRAFLDEVGEVVILASG